MINLTQFEPMLVGEGIIDRFLYNNGTIFLEPKVDGIRLIVQKDISSMKLYTRGGKDVTEKYRDIVGCLCKEIIASKCILDGELCVMNGNHFTSSNYVMRRELQKGEKYVYFVFDILELEGQSLMEDPLLARKQTLNLVINPISMIAQVPFYPTDNKEEINNILKKVLERGMEGVVLKTLGPYIPGSRYNWLKLKPIKSLDLEVLGRVERKDSKGWKYKLLGNGVEANASSTLDIPNGACVEVIHNGRWGSRLRFPRILRVRDDLQNMPM